MEAVLTIGIDPSLTHTGIVVTRRQDTALSHTHSLIVPRKLRGPERLVYISAELRKALVGIDPCLCIMESYNYKGANLAELGEASGVIKMVCAELGHTVLSISPATLKKFATGSSQADKKVIMNRYNIDNEHLADATGLSLFGQVYLGMPSVIRHELEAVRGVKTVKPPKKKIKKLTHHSACLG